jgi:hypothetical protein
MLGIDAKETVEFVSTKDTGDVKTVFTLGSFTNRDKLKIGMGSMDASGKFDLNKFQEKIFDVLKVGVKGIKNLAGKDYPDMTEELLEVIPFDALMEVFQKIMELNFPSEAETKN